MQARNTGFVREWEGEAKSGLGRFSERVPFFSLEATRWEEWVEQAAGLLAAAARLGLSAASAAAFWSVSFTLDGTSFFRRLRYRAVMRFQRAAGNNGPAARSTHRWPSGQQARWLLSAP